VGRARTLSLPTISFVIGAEILFLAAMMLLSLGVSLYYREGDALPIAAAIAITALMGGVCILLGRGHGDISLRDGFAVVTFGWLAMAFTGALPAFFSGAIPSFTDAFFESMSGFTTTGASILGPHNPIESLPHGVLFWRSLTHWIGGMGIILLSLAILPVLSVGGMQLFRAEVPGPTKDKLTPRIRSTAEILWGVYLVISIAEILLLWAGEMNLFEAACHTFGTMATGGFSTSSRSLAAFPSRYSQYVVIVFMFLAGANFALHYRVMRGGIGNYWKSREFRFYLSIVALFSVVMVAVNLLRGGVGGVEETVRASVFQVVSILTTTGYGSADWEKWGVFAQALLLTLMFIGGMAGSTGGGVKVIRVQVVFKQIRLEMQRLLDPQAILPLRLGTQRIEDGIVRNILTFLLVYFLILLVSTVVLTMFSIDLVTAFGAVLACLSNIGPGIGDVGATDNYGWLPGVVKWFLAVIMVLGRLEIYTVVMLFSRHFWRK